MEKSKPNKFESREDIRVKLIRFTTIYYYIYYLLFIFTIYLVFIF